MKAVEQQKLWLPFNTANGVLPLLAALQKYERRQVMSELTGLVGKSLQTGIMNLAACHLFYVQEVSQVLRRYSRT
jgi:hypothetical protein